MGYLPAFFHYQDLKGKKNPVLLDFSNCTSTYSSGLTIFLIHLLQYFGKNHVDSWSIVPPRRQTWSDAGSMEVFTRIVEAHFPNQEIRFKSDLDLNTLRSLEDGSGFTSQMTSLPIYELTFSQHSNRRDALIPFKRWLYDALSPYYERYDFSLTLLTSIANEIAKNSADHTDNNAFMGIDLIESKSKDALKILFAFGDLGLGINQHIKNNLPSDRINRYQYWDLTQTYREALSRGFTTTNESLNNKGIGMSIILDGSVNCGISLSVFDANSRGVLTSIESLTHREIRKHFYHLGRDVGFYYIGELTCPALPSS